MSRNLWRHQRAFIASRVSGWFVIRTSGRKSRGIFPLMQWTSALKWRQEHPGYDLYEPKSAACQLRISVSFLNHSIRTDSSAPVIVGRGLLACNTLHYRAGGMAKDTTKDSNLYSIVHYRLI